MSVLGVMGSANGPASAPPEETPSLEDTAGGVDELPAFPPPGARFSDHLQLVQVLDKAENAAIYLGEDHTRAELVILCLARTTETLEALLAKYEASAVYLRAAFEPWLVAEVAISEPFLEQFMEKMLDVPYPTQNIEHEPPPSAPAPLPQSAISTSRGGAHGTTPSSGTAAAVCGETIAGRYEIQSMLGEGGMGAVYCAQDALIGRTVALKILRPGEGADPAEAMRRVLKEARVVGSLFHPHIVQLYDAGEHNGTAYLALELCEGGSLRQRLQDATPEDKQRWLRQIGEALAYAHDKGVLHRDVKPENVVLTADGVAKLTDFGIARVTHGKDGRSTTGIVGTPRFMAPEQLLGEALDGRTDQYAWALVAVSMWTGSGALRIGAGCKATTLVQAGVPKHLAEVLERCLSYDKLSRYPNIRDAMRAISDGLGDTDTPRETEPSLTTTARASALQHASSTWVLLVLVLGAFALYGGARYATSNKPNSAPSSATSVGNLAPDLRAIDADIVARCAPPARAALRAGLQLWRDASQWESLARLDEAVGADPECAPASLYYLLGASHTLPRRREHYRWAREHRAVLNAREVQLLDALEPTMRDPPDFDEALEKARAVAKVLRGDPDAQRVLVRALFRLGRLDEARATVRDNEAQGGPIVPGNHFLAGLIAVRQRHSDEAEKHFMRCLEVAPDSSDCLQFSGLTLASEGRCAEAEANLRKLVTLMPHSAQGNWNLAQVILARTRDPAAARALFEERWRSTTATTFASEPNQEAARLSDEGRMAVFSGDLESALAYARRWNDSVRASTNGRFRGEPMIQLIELLRELGHENEARATALAALREQRGWSVDEKLDSAIEFARLAYMTGAIDALAYRRFRDTWQAERKPAPTEAWVTAYAGLQGVDHEAPAPVKPGDLVQDWLSMSPESFARAADTLGLQGRHDDAIRHAMAADACCLAFSAVGKLHAETALAVAYDRSGDVERACRSYRTLVERYGHTSSTSARRARQRMKTIKCSQKP